MLFTRALAASIYLLLQQFLISRLSCFSSWFPDLQLLTCFFCTLPTCLGGSFRHLSILITGMKYKFLPPVTGPDTGSAIRIKQWYTPWPRDTSSSSSSSSGKYHGQSVSWCLQVGIQANVLVSVSISLFINVPLFKMTGTLSLPQQSSVWGCSCTLLLFCAY